MEGGTSPPTPHRSRRHLGQGLSLESKDPSVASSRLSPPPPPPLAALNSRICHQDQPAGADGFWRPWISSSKDAERRQEQRALRGFSETTEDSAKLTRYTHPVRLNEQLLVIKKVRLEGVVLAILLVSELSIALTTAMHSICWAIIEDDISSWYNIRLLWPKSRCFDYLYHEAEALLRNFPVQATLSFYEDSESDEGDDELDHDSEAELDC